MSKASDMGKQYKAKRIAVGIVVLEVGPPATSQMGPRARKGKTFKHPQAVRRDEGKTLVTWTPKDFCDRSSFQPLVQS